MFEGDGWSTRLHQLVFSGVLGTLQLLPLSEGMQHTFLCSCTLAGKLTIVLCMNCVVDSDRFNTTFRGARTHPAFPSLCTYSLSTIQTLFATLRPQRLIIYCTSHCEHVGDEQMSYPNHDKAALFGPTAAMHVFSAAATPHPLALFAHNSLTQRPRSFSPIVFNVFRLFVPR